MALSIFYFLGNKFLEKENYLVGTWKIESVNSNTIFDKKLYSSEQKQILIQRDSVLRSKVDSLFLDFKTTRFIFRSTNNGKLETNFFETDKPISWHYLEEKNQITLYRKKEPDVFWEIKNSSDSILIIKTVYGISDWEMTFSKLK